MKTILSCLTTAGLLAWAAADAAAQKMNPTDSPTNNLELATFGGGCFWCIEAVFERLEGVKSVTSGYAGGKLANPTYEQVCSGTSGHAEVAQIAFDPKKITYEKLLETFWEAQKAAAEKSKQAAQAHFSAPIVSEIAPLTQFYKAENYHQDYFRNNPRAPYCSYVIRPKLEKLDQKKAPPDK